MNWKTKTLMVLPVLLGAVALGGWGACCHHGGPPDPAKVNKMVTARVDDALEDLQATPDQKAKVLALKDQLLADGLALRTGQREARTAMVGFWDQAAPDAAKVHALIDARVDAMRKFAHEAADAGLQLHGILTPDQRAKVSKKIHRWTDDG